MNEIFIPLKEVHINDNLIFQVPRDNKEKNIELVKNLFQLKKKTNKTFKLIHRQHIGSVNWVKNNTNKNQEIKRIVISNSDLIEFTCKTAIVKSIIETQYNITINNKILINQIAKNYWENINSKKPIHLSIPLYNYIHENIEDSIVILLQCQSDKVYNIIDDTNRLIFLQKICSYIIKNCNNKNIESKNDGILTFKDINNMRIKRNNYITSNFKIDFLKENRLIINIALIINDGQNFSNFLELDVVRTLNKIENLSSVQESGIINEAKIKYFVQEHNISSDKIQELKKLFKNEFYNLSQEEREELFNYYYENITLTVWYSTNIKLPSIYNVKKHNIEENEKRILTSFNEKLDKLYLDSPYLMRFLIEKYNQNSIKKEINGGKFFQRFFREFNVGLLELDYIIFLLYDLNFTNSEISYIISCIGRKNSNELFILSKFIEKFFSLYDKNMSFEWNYELHLLNNDINSNSEYDSLTMFFTNNNSWIYNNDQNKIEEDKNAMEVSMNFIHKKTIPNRNKKLSNESNWRCK